MDYLLHVLVLIAIYTALTSSLDLLVGHTGMLSVAQAAFFGIGAYTSGLLSVAFGFPFVAGVLAGVGISIVMAIIVALPSVRLKDEYENM